MNTRNLIFEQLGHGEWERIGTAEFDHERTVVQTNPTDLNPQLVRQALADYGRFGFCLGQATIDGDYYRWRAGGHDTDETTVDESYPNGGGRHNFSKGAWGF